MTPGRFDIVLYLRSEDHSITQEFGNESQCLGLLGFYISSLSEAGVGDTVQDKFILTLLAEFTITVPNHFSLFAKGGLVVSSNMPFAIIYKGEA